MIELPIDIIRILLSYSPYSFHITNKDFYDEYLNKANESITKLQTWYRRNMIVDLDCISKERLVQCYNASYEWQYLKNYPIYLANKCSLSRELKEYAYEAQSSNDKKTIIGFLLDSRITKEHILHTGW